MLPLSEKRIEEIAIGDFASFSRLLDASLVDAYADLILDHSPRHVDADFAKSTTFGRRVVHGMLMTSHFSSIVGMLLPGRYALLGSVSMEFLVPVFVDESVTFSARVTHVDSIRSTIKLATQVLRGHTICARGDVFVEVRE